MPFVSGFLRVRRRGKPGQPLPPGEDGVDPGYGVEGPEVSPPEIDNELPEPPPGLWPPLTPEHPWRPIDPGWGQGRPLPPVVGGGPARPPVTPGHPGQPLPEQPEVTPPIALPPGTIWPPLPPGVHGKYWALVAIGGMPGGTVYRYVVVDADARPPRPTDPDYGIEEGGHPDHGLPPSPQPKR